MSNYINKLFYMLAAVLTSNVVYMVYEINSAFAVTCPMIGSTAWANSNCSISSTCSSGGCRTSDCWREWEAMCEKSNVPGWTCAGSKNGSLSAYCNCSSVNYYQPEISSSQIMACGTVYRCGSSINEGVTWIAECHTGGQNKAGFAMPIGASSARCICCPKAAAVAGGALSVYSIPGAEYEEDCYVVGTIQDDSGLYEYTDDDKCHYSW